jgi:hypothetical protein
MVTVILLIVIPILIVFLYPRIGYEWAISRVIPVPAGSKQIGQKMRMVDYGYSETTRIYSVPHTLSETFRWLVSQGGIFFYEELSDEASLFHSVQIDPFRRQEFFWMVIAGNVTRLWSIDALPIWCFQVSAYSDIRELPTNIDKSIIPQSNTVLVTQSCWRDD